MAKKTKPSKASNLAKVAAQTKAVVPSVLGAALKPTVKGKRKGR